MIPGYQLLARRIRSEINELERSVRRVERAWQAAGRAPPFPRNIPVVYERTQA